MGTRLTSILFITFLLSSIITTTLMAALINLRPTDANNVHCDMSAMGYVIAWLGVIILTLGTAPVYFNLINRVNRYYILSLLSFLFVPVAIAIWYAFSFQILSLMVSAPYLSILTLQFFRFKKQTRS